MKITASLARPGQQIRRSSRNPIVYTVVEVKPLNDDRINIVATVAGEPKPTYLSMSRLALVELVDLDEVEATIVQWLPASSAGRELGVAAYGKAADRKLVAVRLLDGTVQAV